MKKFMALLCAGVLACSMSLVAFAAESPSTSTTDNQVVGNSTVEEVRVWDTVLVDGKEVSGGISIGSVSEVKEAEAKTAAAAQISSNATVLEVVDVNYSGSFSKITISFNVKNVVAGQNIIVLHQKADGTWETITPDRVENGKVVVTFTSLSPVAFVLADGSAVVSPKTGDVAVPFVALIAVAAFAGAVVAGKKAFN